VSSRDVVFHRADERWTASMSLFGAAVWCGFAVLAGVHRVHLGIIELLFLLAPLVIVPLGLELAHSLDEKDIVPLPTRRGIQVVATVAACVSMTIPPGRTAALVALIWFLQCAVLTYSRLGHRHKNCPISSRIAELAFVDLLLGAAWLVVSRASWRPVGFQEPIILLTAVHFHYSGFATALLASPTLRSFETRGTDARSLRLLLVTIVLLSFAVAVGFVFSPLLRFAAAVALSLGVTAMAIVWLRLSRNFENVHARFFLRFAACAVVVALSLSSVYAASEYFGKGWITVPRMANTHGVLNGLGFVLTGLLAWLTEGVPARNPRKEPETEFRPQAARQASLPTNGNRKRPAPASPSRLPEFVAREFYDR